MNYDEAYDAIEDEIRSLRGAKHTSASHETDAAKVDTVGSFLGPDGTPYCFGCRRNILSTVLSDMDSFVDDTRVRPLFRNERGGIRALGSQSRRDMALEAAMRQINAKQGH